MTRWALPRARGAASGFGGDGTRRDSPAIPSLPLHCVLRCCRGWRTTTPSRCVATTPLVTVPDVWLPGWFNVCWYPVHSTPYHHALLAYLPHARPTRTLHARTHYALQPAFCVGVDRFWRHCHPLPTPYTPLLPRSFILPRTCRLAFRILFAAVLPSLLYTGCRIWFAHGTPTPPAFSITTHCCCLRTLLPATFYIYRAFAPSTWLRVPILVTRCVVRLRPPSTLPVVPTYPTVCATQPLTVARSPGPRCGTRLYAAFAAVLPIALAIPTPPTRPPPPPPCCPHTATFNTPHSSATAHGFTHVRVCENPHATCTLVCLFGCWTFVTPWLLYLIRMHGGGATIPIIV